MYLCPSFGGIILFRMILNMGIPLKSGAVPAAVSFYVSCPTLSHCSSKAGWEGGQEEASRKTCQSIEFVAFG